MTTATAIRDAIVARLTPAGHPYLQVRKTPVPQLQPDKLPALTVFVLQSRSAPDGEANAGEPRFDVEDTIAISVSRGFADTVTLEGQLDVEVDGLLEALLTDPTFVHFGPAALFEAITSIGRRWVFPQDGETYFAELRLEMTFLSRVSYPPVIEDDFETMNVRTTFPIGGDAESTQQVVAEYDLPQN